MNKKHLGAVLPLGLLLLAAPLQSAALAIYTEFDPNHGYGNQTLQGIAGRLLQALPPGQ